MAMVASPAALAGSSLRISPRSPLNRRAFSQRVSSLDPCRLTVRAAGDGPLTNLKKTADSTKVDISKEEVLRHQEQDESEKRSVVGTIPKSGATIPRPEVERRPETGDNSFVRQMSFDGAGPETINGRLAMVGFVWALVAEWYTHQSVLEQVTAPGNKGLLYFVAVAQVLAYASLVPILQRESPDSRRWGPFNAKAERWNGRLAMLGFAGLVISEVIRGSALIH